MPPARLLTCMAWLKRIICKAWLKRKRGKRHVIRKAALLVGIDDYARAPLNGCVNDVSAMEALLSHNEDGSSNFQCRTLLAPRSATPAPSSIITRATLREQVHDIFAKRVDMALFYFSGHGMITQRGGILVTQDWIHNDEGITMSDIVDAANRSTIEEITIIVDACFSGQLGSAPTIREEHALLRKGVSIIAASSANEAAMERTGGGVFTSLVCGALQGGASDVMGEVTSASIYAYAEQALGPLDQRPMFKSNVARLSPLRSCHPVVPADILRKLKIYFLTPDFEFQLDPAYEPDHKQHPPGITPDPLKETIFKELQKFRDARLLVPVGEEHLYYAAINSKSCRLTPLGQFYWKRAMDGLL
jgi:hypothetical protein